MKVFRGFEGVGRFNNPVVTTGSFDGVHIGHKAIINRLKRHASIIKGETLLITFYPHPRKVLYPETEGKNLRLITTLEEKIYLLEKTGLDNVIIVEFTPEFAKTTCEEFVKKYLVETIGAKVVVVGFNHYFGWHRQGDFHFLQELGRKYGFEAEEIPEQEIEHEAVSSTRIRKAISEGYIQRANAYLESFYMITGQLTETKEFELTGHNFFRMHIYDKEDKLVPPPGIYATSIEKEKRKVRGLVLITGKQETEKEIYFHPLDNSINFVLEKTRILFHKRITEEIEVKDQKILINSLGRAIRETEELIY